MTKKYIYILFSIIFVISLTLVTKKEVIVDAFNEVYNDYDFHTYTLKFNECDLSTSNFIEVFSYFDNKNYKILSITPYINVSYENLFSNIKFNYYSSDLRDILSDFKSEYIDTMNNENYISNICIKSIKINTANIYIKEFKNIIPFTI